MSQLHGYGLRYGYGTDPRNTVTKACSSTACSINPILLFFPAPFRLFNRNTSGFLFRSKLCVASHTRR